MHFDEHATSQVSRFANLNASTCYARYCSSMFQTGGTIRAQRAYRKRRSCSLHYFEPNCGEDMSSSIDIQFVTAHKNTPAITLTILTHPCHDPLLRKTKVELFYAVFLPKQEENLSADYQLTAAIVQPLECHTGVFGDHVAITNSCDRYDHKPGMKKQTVKAERCAGVSHNACGIRSCHCWSHL